MGGFSPGWTLTFLHPLFPPQPCWKPALFQKRILGSDRSHDSPQVTQNDPLKVGHQLPHQLPCSSEGKESPAMQEILVGSLGGEDPVEKGMATHASILAWRIPWTEEPGGLQSIGSQRVGHNGATTAFTFQHPHHTFTPWRLQVTGGQSGCRSDPWHRHEPGCRQDLITELRAPLAVQWLRLHALSAGGSGSIPGQGGEIPHGARCNVYMRGRACKGRVVSRAAPTRARGCLA